jgi:hypothetical protein
MSGLFSKWIESYFQGKRIFDKSLFRMTANERIAKYGIDEVAELQTMSPAKRVEIYGEDFEQYLSSAKNA